MSSLLKYKINYINFAFLHTKILFINHKQMKREREKNIKLLYLLIYHCLLRKNYNV